jgi:hypothetical protein
MDSAIELAIRFGIDYVETSALSQGIISVFGSVIEKYLDRAPSISVALVINTPENLSPQPAIELNKPGQARPRSAAER